MDLRDQNAYYDEDDNQNEEYKEETQGGKLMKLLVKKEGEVKQRGLEKILIPLYSWKIIEVDW